VGEASVDQSFYYWREIVSEITHYSDAEDNEIPRRFLCRRKPKDGSTWTRSEWIVDCPQCLAKLRDDRSNAAVVPEGSKE
jgi:hypothetical protein